MFVDKYHDLQVWTSKEGLTRLERWVLDWKFYPKSPTRSTLYTVTLCLAMPLMLVVLGLLGVSATLLVPLVAVLVDWFILCVLGGFYESRLNVMRADHRFRFKRMWTDAPAFELASRYCEALHDSGVETDGVDTRVVLRGLPFGDPLVDKVLSDWLEARWKADYYCIRGKPDGDAIECAEFRIEVVEQTVASFRQLELDLPSGMDDIYADVIGGAWDRYRREIKLRLDLERRDAQEQQQRVEQLELQLLSAEQGVRI